MVDADKAREKLNESVRGKNIISNIFTLKKQKVVIYN